MNGRLARVCAWWNANVRSQIPRQDGFQTAEAIGIAAVGLLVLVVIYVALSALGLDVVDWIRDTFGIGDDAPTAPAGA